MKTMPTFCAYTLVAKYSMDSPCVLTVFGGVALFPLASEVKEVARHLYLFQRFSLSQNIPFLLKSKIIFESNILD